MTISDRLCIIQLGLHQRKLSIVNVYAPKEEKEDWIKEEFCEKIEEILQGDTEWTHKNSNWIHKCRGRIRRDVQSSDWGKE